MNSHPNDPFPDPEDWENQMATQWGVIDPSRPRGILNERARKYLLDASLIESKSPHKQEIIEKIKELDIEPGSSDDRFIRQEIRTWTINAIFDFAILAGHLEDRDKRKILNDGWDPERPQERGDKPPIFKVRDDLPILITFIYQLYQLDSGNVATGALEEIVKNGIESAHATDGEYATANVKIEVETGPDLNELESKLEQQGPAAVTEDQAFLLYKADRISLSEYTQVLEEIEE